MIKIGNLQIIWWGFFDEDECDECGRGKFNWSYWKPFWGKCECIFYFLRWGPVEFRYIIGV